MQNADKVNGLANLAYLNCHPKLETLRANTLEGLASKPKRIASKFLYDKKGSELFDMICSQPEYYQTDAEIEILDTYAHEMMEAAGIRTLLLEFGSGHSRKVRKLLDHMPKGSAFVPLDISGDYLLEHAAKIASMYSGVDVTAVCADFLQPIPLPSNLDKYTDRVVFFPGSTIGNFEPPTQLKILGNVRSLLGSRGKIIIGVDRKNPLSMLEAAYNDKAGMTAAFELNLLNRINRELGADFDTSQFQYRGFYNQDMGRIEMYLVSLCDQVVTIDGNTFTFSKDEMVHVENSYKYEPDEFANHCQKAGLKLHRKWTDKLQRFNVYMLEAG